MYRPHQPGQGKPQPGDRTPARDGSLLELKAEIDETAAALRRARGSAAGGPSPPAPSSPGTIADFLPGLERVGAIGPDHVFSWLRDGLLWIAVAFFLCVGVALAYALTASPRYTVYTDIVVDPSNLNVVSDDVFATSPQRDAQLLEVESKLRVLTSRNVLGRVIEDLRLYEDREFIKPGIGDFIKALLPFGETEQSDGRLTAMRALSERVEARREERSFVVALGVWTEDPLKSVTVSDAIVDAFEAELFQSAAESAGRVAQNLGNRLDELRRNVTEAERRVEEFRRANGLQSSNGELVSAQLSTELNTQVLEAQQRLIQAQSRHAQMEAAIAQGLVASASIFESPSMTSLRAQMNTLQQQLGAMQRTYGARHPRMASTQSELAALESAMEAEARRTLERARGDMTREQAAFDALRGHADDERFNVFTDNAAQVELRDLERDARTRAAIYETQLARTQQIAERQQIDATNVRVISRAVPPQSRSWPPRTLVLLAAGAIVGTMLGLGLALALGLWRFLRAPRPETA